MGTLDLSQPRHRVEWHLNSALQRHPLIAYFALANGFSWLTLLVLAA
jgi:hypothetical protein